MQGAVGSFAFERIGHTVEQLSETTAKPVDLVEVGVQDVDVAQELGETGVYPLVVRLFGEFAPNALHVLAVDGNLGPGRHGPTVRRRQLSDKSLSATLGPMSEPIPPVEPSNHSVPISIAAAEALDKYLEDRGDPEARAQRNNVLVMVKALDVQDMLLVRLEEILAQSKAMIESERPPHIHGLSWASLHLGSLSYLMAFGHLFLRGLYLWLLWGWFVEPLGAPSVSLGVSLGLVLFLTLLGRTNGIRSRNFTDSRRRETNPVNMRRLLYGLAGDMFFQAVIFGLAFLLHLAIS